MGISAVNDCVFCNIIGGHAPGSSVYEDEVVAAIMTIGPVNPGHIMVIPKEHIAYMADMDEETGQHDFNTAMRLAQAIRESGVRCEGINLFLADGEAAFQEIFHLHLHVFPRFKGDDFSLEANWDVRPSRSELDHVAEMICHAYERM